MNKVIILDAGHGDRHHTKGKRSPIWSDGSQYFEGEGNREIVKIATQYLRKLGWTVLYTTHPDSWYDLPLKERIKNSNGWYKHEPDAFQISVHSNAYKKNIGEGAEVHVLKGASSNSFKLAEIWLNEHVNNFTPLKNRGLKETRFAMNKVNCVSILIETMFHSFERECRTLMSDNGKEQIAIGIVETAEQYYKYLTT